MTDIAQSLGVSPHVFTKAIDMISAPGTSCVAIRKDALIHTADGRGVAPLLDLYHKNQRWFVRKMCRGDS